MRIRLRSGEVEGARVSRPGGEVSLTPREAELLGYLVRHVDRVVGRDELLEHVFRMPTDRASRAVDVAVRRLREKVERDPEQPDHVVTVFGQGYRFVPAEAPAPPDPGFVGRAGEVAAVRAALEGPCRVAIVGPPGVGKTRLARRALDGLPPPTWVDLTTSRDASWVRSAIARALLLEVGGTGWDRVADRLAATPSSALVLDNCEGAHEGVEEAAAELARRVPTLRLVLTSRRALAGDPAVTLGPLPPADAAALFVRLASEHRPAVAHDPLVPELVEALEQIPLAIALAAGRAAAMSVRAMLDRMSDRFRLLASPGEPRGRTLLAALQGSWELASPREREVLTACAAFRGGFTEEAAVAVSGGADVPAVLRDAARSSLVEWRGDRYGGYAFVREFVAARLAEDPGRERAVFAAHRRWFVGVALASPPGHLRGRRLRPEVDNLVAAARRAIADGDGPAACVLVRAAIDVLGQTGPFPVALELVDALAALPGLPEAEQVGLAVARVAFAPDQHAVAAAIDGTVARARALGDPLLLARALRARAMVRRERTSLAPALADLEEAEVRVRGLDDEVHVNVLETLGSVLRLLGRTREAIAWHRELEVRTRGAPDPLVRVHALGNLGLLERKTGDLSAAEDRFREAADLAAEAGLRRAEATARSALGSLLLDRGDLTGARAQYEAGLLLVRRLSDAGQAASLESNLSLVDRLAGDLAGAERRVRAALAWFQDAGEDRQAALAQGNLGELLLRAGRAAEARPWLEASLDWLARAGEVAAEAELRSVLAEVWLALGEPETAARALDRAEAVADRSGSPLVQGMVRARRGLWEVATGRDARASLAAAAGLAGGAGPTSDAGAAVARLRDALRGVR